mgnify:CR=1 FL=1
MRKITSNALALFFGLATIAFTFVSPRANAITYEIFGGDLFDTVSISGQFTIDDILIFTDPVSAFSNISITITTIPNNSASSPPPTTEIFTIVTDATAPLFPSALDLSSAIRAPFGFVINNTIDVPVSSTFHFTPTQILSGPGSFLGNLVV